MDGVFTQRTPPNGGKRDGEQNLTRTPAVEQQCVLPPLSGISLVHSLRRHPPQQFSEGFSFKWLARVHPHKSACALPVLQKLVLCVLFLYRWCGVVVKLRAEQHPGQEN